MQLRIMGTEAECEAVVDALAEVVGVREVSAWYRNRSRSRVVSTLGRVYVEIDAPTAVATVRVQSQRVGQVDAPADTGRRALPGGTGSGRG